MEYSNEKIPIGFLGYGTKALDALMESSYFEVKYFFVPEDRLCDDVYEAEKKYSKQIKMEIIGNANELYEKIKGVHNVECFLMNACSIIITENILKKMKFFNIHPGDLKKNRGHHPHLWSILLEEKESKIVLHSVTPYIDLGEVIGERIVPIEEEEDEKTLLNKLEDNIPQLLCSFYDYLKGKQNILYTITNGEYRPKLNKKDYSIDVISDHVDLMKRKIRTRAAHNGAIIKVGIWEVYVNQLIRIEKNNVEDFHMYIKNKKLYLQKDGMVCTFRISKIVM